LRADDRLVSWLPMYHDMGLIAMLLFPVYFQLDALILTPEQFVRRPQRWADAFAQQGATWTAAPPYGYQVLLSRLAGRGADLRNWRVAACGAEPIEPLLLQRFSRALAGDWFSPL